MKINECEASRNIRNIPMLIIVGESDDVVGVDEAQEIYASANEPRTLLIIKSADHIYKGKEQKLINKTIEWIKKRQQGDLGS